MNRYQWLLFVVTGCGWIVDNFWSQSIGDIQTTVKLEFSGIVSVHYSSVAYYIGLILGASFWSISADFVWVPSICTFLKLPSNCLHPLSIDWTQASIQRNNIARRYLRLRRRRDHQFRRLQCLMGSDRHGVRWQRARGQHDFP